MSFHLRIARLPTVERVPASVAGEPLSEWHSRLVAAIRRHLAHAAGSILAQPVIGAAQVEWYSDLAGQPLPLERLDGEARRRATLLLEQRLDGLRQLASRLGQHGQASLAEAMTLAAAPPPPGAVYVVGGQPVLIDWDLARGAAPAGILPAGGPVIPGAAGMTAVPPPDPGGWSVRRVALWAALLLLLLLVLGFGLRGCTPFDLPGLVGDFRPAAPDLAELQAENEALLKEQAALERRLGDALLACSGPAPHARPLPALPAPAPLPTEPVQPVLPEAQVPTGNPPEPTPEPAPEPTPEPGPTTSPPTVAPTPRPAPPPRESRAATPPPPARCPSPRPIWEAPEIVVVLDSSGSMGLPTDMPEAEIRALTDAAGRGDAAAARRLQDLTTGNLAGTRLKAAQDAVINAVDALPGDVSTGLVVFGDCRGADSHQFFSPAERPRLGGLLRSMTPQSGTPLARGVERAGNIVDGRDIPAILVVVSDGEDSCGGDPCAVARRLKAEKPNLRINYVDVAGNGDGRCLAELTGGQVFTATQGIGWEELIRRSLDQPPVPAECRRP